MKIVYAFDRSTREYVGPVELNETDLSPLGGPEDYLIPGSCLEVKPPSEVPEDSRVIEQNGDWAIVPKLPPVEPPTLPEGERPLSAAEVRRALERLATDAGLSLDNLLAP